MVQAVSPFGRGLEDLVWSAPIPFDGGRADGMPQYGVYRHKLVDGQGRPIPIVRLHGKDEQGILYIGATPKPNGRLAQRFGSEQRPYLEARHNERHDQYLFWRDVRRVYGENAGILFEYVGTEDNWQAFALELALQGDYAFRFLEKPESGPLEVPDYDPRWPLHNENHVWRRWLQEQVLQQR